MPCKKEIKTSNNEKGKTLVKVSGKSPLDNKIVFSFSFFMVKVFILEILIIFIRVKRMLKKQQVIYLKH